MTFVEPLIILAGIALAILGAHLLVDGGVALATRYGIPQLIIGSTIVAFGTSMPEFAVNVSAAIEHSTSLAVGNILGSNIFNILFILGILALMSPLEINEQAAAKDFPMETLAAIMIVICGFTYTLDGVGSNALYFSDGLVLLCFFGIFLYYTLNTAMVNTKIAGYEPVNHAIPKPVHRLEHLKHGTFKSVSYIIIGLICLVFGGELIVDGAQNIAIAWGISEKAIGLLIVGPGTSFPEFVASVVAALKKRVDLVVGNVVGSNIFNVFFTLGVTSLIADIPITEALAPSVITHLIASALLLIFAFTGKHRVIGRTKGSLFLIIYAGFLGYSFYG